MEKLSLVDLALVQLLTMSATPPPHKLKLFGQILGALIELFGLTLIVTGASASPLIFFPRRSHTISFPHTAVTRYFSMQRALIAGMFPTAGAVLLAIAGGMLVLILITFALVLAIALT